MNSAYKEEIKQNKQREHCADVDVTWGENVYAGLGCYKIKYQKYKSYKSFLKF